MKRKTYTLRITIGSLVLCSVLLTAIVMGFSAVKAKRESLKLTYIQNNYHYAQKLSSETNNLVATMQKNINSIANMAKKHMYTQEELDLLLATNNEYFNSIFIVDSNRIIQRVSPVMPTVREGTQLISQQSIDASKLKKPNISEPYVATSKRMILLISAPIFNDFGQYTGFVGGTIYLEEENVLGSILKDHFYGNKSYVYVVDSYGNIIFHPDKKRINENVLNNQVVNKVTRGFSGTEKIKNTKGIDYLVGYVYEPSTGWGIVSQTPSDVVNEPLKHLMLQMGFLSFPFIVLILWVTFLLSNYISKPLNNLAGYSKVAYLQSKNLSITPKTNSLIYEVRQLYYHFENHINHLQAEIQLDGLTLLANRKTFDRVAKEWMVQNIDFSLILLDIDHFKKINDSYGHLAGDEVLKFIASKIRTCSRDADFCFRYGGEEFGVLVKFGNQEQAYMLAEMLRSELVQNVSPIGEYITISAGIGTIQEKHQTQKDLIEMADLALYQSKITGRNKTTIYQGSELDYT